MTTTLWRRQQSIIFRFRTGLTKSCGFPNAVSFTAANPDFSVASENRRKKKDYHLCHLKRKQLFKILKSVTMHYCSSSSTRVRGHIPISSSSTCGLLKIQRCLFLFISQFLLFPVNSNYGIPGDILEHSA